MLKFIFHVLLYYFVVLVILKIYFIFLIPIANCGNNVPMYVCIYVLSSGDKGYNCFVIYCFLKGYSDGKFYLSDFSES